jgi:hypothetical protein
MINVPTAEEQNARSLNAVEIVKPDCIEHLFHKRFSLLTVILGAGSDSQKASAR